MAAIDDLIAQIEDPALRERLAQVERDHVHRVVPSSSYVKRTRGGDVCHGPEEVEVDFWFDNWRRSGVLLEEARHFPEWDQTFALLWFEDEELPALKPSSPRHEEEVGLAEFDGILPWPGKKRRK